MTDPVAVPSMTTTPPFPDLADRAAGTYNLKAFNFGAHMSGPFNGELEAIVDAAYTNAVAANERASTATDKAALTAADAEQTALDRIQTGLDREAAIAIGKRYLGGKSVAPTLDNDDAALQAGAVYYDTVLLKVMTWTGTLWTEGLSAVAGVSSINSATGAITLKTLNGTSLLGAGDIVLSTDAIRAPSNVTPAAAATSVNEAPTLTGSPYYSLYGLPMAAAQFQVSTAADFSSTVVSTGDVAGSSISYLVPSGVLAVNSVYYWRVRYKDGDGVYSAWSAGTSFTTKSDFNDYIATPTATPAAFGDAFEGGFYTGMIWNELVQTATSTLIGTGSKTFTVANMTSTPIVYAGQTLEVRSRANPVNKMIGVVTAALGTSLTVNITSVGGSGTFTDWSIMAQYRVIVAPKSSGENAAIAYKNANTAAPAACGTLSEGYKATMAMVAADTSTVYPAAHWCKTLSIAGKTDWYLPARDELELAWRNLKPTADANYVTADRSAGATPNYMNLGSYGDTAATHGLDNNSSPAGAAHTSGVPAQVAAGKNFRTGEAEAFVYGSANYWSASEYSATAAWGQYWYSSFPGDQGTATKTSAYVVRAVRRSII